MVRSAAVALALLLALFVAACGGGEEKSTAPDTVEGTLQETDTGEAAPGEGQGDPEAGKEVYASAGCGSCHTLEAAGSSGTTGPNLDEASPDYEAAREQIENGGGGMPPFKDQLSEQEIADVAAFVVESAGG